MIFVLFLMYESLYVAVNEYKLQFLTCICVSVAILVVDWKKPVTIF